MVIHLRKQLVAPPAAAELPKLVQLLEFCVRTMAVPEDVPAWLALRERAIADLTPRPRSWLHADYEAEMFDKPWWNAERNLVAFHRDAPSELIGAVTLAIREGAYAKVPVVHWLLVDPRWRRRGVGRMLMAGLEQMAFAAGYREVELETHTGWAAAVAFYQSIGYAPVRPSPR
jgi:GNAT superfamily N-acetyltransferase